MSRTEYCVKSTGQSYKFSLSIFLFKSKVFFCKCKSVNQRIKSINYSKLVQLKFLSK